MGEDVKYEVSLVHISPSGQVVNISLFFPGPLDQEHVLKAVLVCLHDEDWRHRESAIIITESQEQ